MIDEEAEGALAKRAAAGDSGAFERLVDRCEKPLFNVALRLVRNREDACDITQTAFLKAYQNLHTYDAGRKFFSWIYRIAVNEALNLMKRREVRAGWRPEPPAVETPEDTFRTGEIRREIETSIMRLSPDHRVVIVLRHIGGLSHREMGTILEIPEKTVKSRLYTARRKLSELLVERGITTG